MTTNLDSGSIEARFTAEFRNRLDSVIHFNPLNAALLTARANGPPPKKAGPSIPV